MSKKKGKKKGKKVEISIYGNGQYLGSTTVIVGVEYTSSGIYLNGAPYTVTFTATGEDVYITATRKGSLRVSSASEENAFSEEFPGTGKAMATGAVLGLTGFDFG